MKFSQPTTIVIVLLNAFHCALCGIDFSPDKIAYYRERVKKMFYHAYDGYLNFAFPYDELKPITCTGMDTWGSFSLTLVDALDTLIVMGNYTEFQRATKIVLKSIDFDANVNVSVFETNIRVIGGLLSAHMLSGIAGIQLEDGWPCSGPLLSLAERMASKLLPAFNSYTGMPYGTVNLRYGVHRHETPITCTAGAGTFLLEFSSLSRLTGSPIYERVALKASNELWKARSSIGLVGNHINVQTGAWTATDAGIGAGVDSYFEYLVKASILLNKPELMRQFKEYQKAIQKYLQKDDWFMWASMSQGQITMPVFQSLEAFWPGLLTLVGNVDSAMRILLNYHQVLKQYGFTPEFYNIPNAEIVHKRGGYPLRPELAESLMYLYRATRDPLLLQIGAELIEAIEHSAKTKCGYATIHDVKDHIIEDRMESFFLAETTKYLYLLFDPDNFIHNPGDRGVVVDTTNGKCVINSGGYVFNTEAHPLDPSILYCCDKRRQRDNEILSNFHDNLNILGVLGLSPNALHDSFEFTTGEFGDEIAGETNETMRHEHNLGDLVDYETTDEESNESSLPDSGNAPAERPEVKENDVVGESSGYVEAVPSITASNKVLMPPEKRSPSHASGSSLGTKTKSKPTADKTTASSTSSFADTVIKALSKVVDEWKHLLDAEKALESLAKLKKASAESRSFCRRDEQTSSSKALNAMLNVVYARERLSYDERASSNFQCDPADAPREEEHYVRTPPDAEALSNLDEDFTDDWTVKRIDLKTYNKYANAADYHYELMSCKPRTFSSKFTGLGEVISTENRS